MATIGPASWKGIDPRQDPESAKRLASGFWTHDFDMCTQIDSWACDKRKLHDVVARKMMDPVFRKYMTDYGPTRTLDMMFGEGTGEAFAHSGGERIAMGIAQFDSLERKERNMALNRYYTGWSDTIGTSTNTFTSTSSNSNFLDSGSFTSKAKKKKVADSYRQPSTLVRNLPFVCNTDDLIGTLQREFNYWAGKQLDVLRG